MNFVIALLIGLALTWGIARSHAEAAKAGTYRADAEMVRAVTASQLALEKAELRIAELEQSMHAAALLCDPQWRARVLR